MKTIITLLMLFSASATYALDCNASKDDQAAVTFKSGKSTLIDSYQFDAIEVDSNHLVLIIFDRRTPSSSSRTVLSGRTVRQTVETVLETSEGTYHLVCKK